jgi:hypothetical protein
MYGDFARVTFDALKSRSRVLMQQGRVQLEADWNEQGAIFLHLLRTLTKDLIGPAGGPEGNCGFAIVTRGALLALPATDPRREWLSRLPESADFLIGAGHYYVDGVFCANPDLIRYSAQTAIGAPPEKLDVTDAAMYLAYLDVVEHSVFAAQDESLLEVALGVETTLRARVSWTVRTSPVTSGNTCDNMDPSWTDLMNKVLPANRGWLTCRAGSGGDEEDSATPCIVAPRSRYRGPENQLYRIEVHTGGVIETTRTPARKKKADEQQGGDGPTFKFSRVNGSAMYGVEAGEDGVFTLLHLGKDERLDLDEGDWVEMLDDSAILSDTPGPLRRVAKVDTFTREITLEPLAGTSMKVDPSRRQFLRRWDQRQGDPDGNGLQLRDGVAPIELDEWLPLEDGIEIRFQAPPNVTGPVVFRAGDYWLAPARVATGGIIDWPQVDGKPQAIPPHGVEHHYAPLAIMKVIDGQLTLFGQCRRTFQVPSKGVQSEI